MPSPDEINEIYLEHRPMLRRFLFARLDNEADVDELLQDLWLKLERSKVKTINSPISYLCRMADNAIRDRRRSLVSQDRRERKWIEHNVPKVGPAGYHSGPGPDRQLISREELDLVERSLSELPDRTEYIFRAFRVDGRRQQELADELGISLSAVEKHLQKAYRKIVSVRQHLDAEYGDDTV